ncbi:unnamed protein product [Rotaria magnacalcarata]
MSLSVCQLTHIALPGKFSFVRSDSNRCDTVCLLWVSRVSSTGSFLGKKIPSDSMESTSSYSVQLLQSICLLY